MSRRYLFPKVIFVFLLVGLMFFSSTSCQQPYEVKSIEITVFRDGFIRVTQTISVNETSPFLTLKLLSPSVEDILVLDQANSPLSYDVSAANITIDTLGATHVTLEYLTSTLTSKQGAVWTLTVNTPYSASIILPEKSTIMYLNDLPSSIKTKDNRLILSVDVGFWEVGYTTSSPAETPTGPSEPTGPAKPVFIIGGVAAAILIALVIILFRGRRLAKGRSEEELQLKPEDRDVLRFIEERGGRVSEVELRQKFNLPKTSMWRLARRLERMGFVRIRRMGMQNEIELVK